MKLIITQVSSKYLDLTKKKLELTRLPHELLLPKERAWELGTPKSEVEPLVDFWCVFFLSFCSAILYFFSLTLEHRLEQYNWRAREAHLNTTLPQFRTGISIPSSPNPLRIHFIHIRSPKPHAIPLLLLPSFPLTNLSLAPLFASLTSPADAATQAFHVVVPSLPGLGFSDAFQTDEKLLLKTAGAYDVLMRRLGYAVYLASGTGSGRESPAGLDYHVLRLLAEKHHDSCLGAHLIDPHISCPTPSTQPLHWLKFTLARFFHAEIFGYQKRDFLTLKRHHARGSLGRGMGALGLGLAQPSTLSYALCDSPVGLLAFVCAGLRRANPKHALAQLEVVDLAQLAWLPGPEAGMRFVCAAAREVREMGGMGVEEKEKGRKSENKSKSRVVVTVFGGGDGDVEGEREVEGEAYTCPAWAAQRHEVLWSQRVDGRAGLLVFERPDVIITGIRELARRMLDVDGRLSIAALEAVVVAPGAGEEEEQHDDGAIVEIRELGSTDGDGEWEDSIEEERASQLELDMERDREGGGEHGMQLDVESPDTVVGVEVGSGRVLRSGDVREVRI